jgi:aspartokinase
MAALHPAAMEPLRGTKAVVYVKSVGAPHLKGTRISSGGGGSRCAGITLSPGHVLYTARTGAMVDAVGSLRAASNALNEMGYPVGLTASGQTSFTLSACVANKETAAVRERILTQCGVETEVTYRTGCTILTIVGGNRGVTPKVLAAITAALARARIPVISISMAASLRLDSYPTSCQVVVADRRGKNALSVVHVALYGKPPKRTRKRKS